MLERINVKELENSVKSIGDDWMLITVADEKNGRVNAMTASWGAMGVLWNKPVCICFVRPERYTFELLAEHKELSVAFLGSQRRDALAFCGRESGRDLDKLEKCGLTTFELDGIPVITEAQAALTCRVLYPKFHPQRYGRPMPFPGEQHRKDIFQRKRRSLCI